MGDKARQKGQIARHFSRAAASYDAATPVQQQSAEALFANLGAFFPHSSEPSLLDIGVGTGRLFRVAQRHFGTTNFAVWRLHGIDFAPLMLEQTRKQFPRARLCCGDAESFAYAADAYDLIISNFALQWCQQPALLLHRLYAALRPGGCLAVALPLCGSLAELFQCVRRICARELALYPLPQLSDFQKLARDLPGMELKEQYFYVEYQNAYEALAAIKQAGAHTARAPLAVYGGITGDGHAARGGTGLGFIDLNRLRQSESLQLDYRVLLLAVERC